MYLILNVFTHRVPLCHSVPFCHRPLRMEPFMSQRLRPPREHKSAEGLITICSVHRRIERLWAERIKSLRQIRGQLDVATDRVQSAFNNKVR
jgi:hypothetical protein